MRNINVILALYLLAFVALIATGVFATANAAAMSDANCNACVSSYHCDSYQQSCVKDCAAKAAAGGGEDACGSSCAGASAKCVADAKVECKEYCKQ